MTTVKEAVIARFQECMKEKNIKANELPNGTGVFRLPFIPCRILAQENHRQPGEKALRRPGNAHGRIFLRKDI